jgi:hypothetical protein
MASHSHNTCVEQRSLVRSSSSWRCGSRRWQKERSCKVCACSQAASQKGWRWWPDGSRRPVLRRKGPAHRLAQTAPSRFVERGFQTVQGSVASSRESGAAGLTAKGLDPLGMAMRAIPHQSMHVSVSDAGVEAFSVRTGEALCVHPLRGSPAAFDLTRIASPKILLLTGCLPHE